MSVPLATEIIPLQKDRDGVIRVGGTRVTLDTVVHAFQNGATAEEIVQRYPTLALADVYMVISYYLRRQDEVDAYLEQGKREAQEIRQQIEGSPHRPRSFKT